MSGSKRRWMVVMDGGPEELSQQSAWMFPTGLPSGLHSFSVLTPSLVEQVKRTCSLITRVCLEDPACYSLCPEHLLFFMDHRPSYLSLQRWLNSEEILAIPWNISFQYALSAFPIFSPQHLQRFTSVHVILSLFLPHEMMGSSMLAKKCIGSFPLFLD